MELLHKILILLTIGVGVYVSLTVLYTVVRNLKKSDDDIKTFVFKDDRPHQIVYGDFEEFKHDMELYCELEGFSFEDFTGKEREQVLDSVVITVD